MIVFCWVCRLVGFLVGLDDDGHSVEPHDFPGPWVRKKNGLVSQPPFLPPHSPHGVACELQAPLSQAPKEHSRPGINLGDIPCHRTVSKQTASGGRERVRFSDAGFVVGRVPRSWGWIVIPLAFAFPAGGRIELLQ